MYLFLTKTHQDGDQQFPRLAEWQIPEMFLLYCSNCGCHKNDKGGPADLRSLTMGSESSTVQVEQSYHRSPETPGPLLRSEGRQPEACLALAGFGGGEEPMAKTADGR